MMVLKQVILHVCLNSTHAHACYIEGCFERYLKEERKKKEKSDIRYHPSPHDILRTKISYVYRKN